MIVEIIIHIKIKPWKGDIVPLYKLKTHDHSLKTWTHLEIQFKNTCLRLEVNEANINIQNPILNNN